jgi:hypothetical protein
MSIDQLLGKTPKVPDLPQVPQRTDPSIAAAKRRQRLGTQSITRRTVLGGRTGGSENVARKTLLGE